ncbi:asparagine synthase (glutamine-hydrolyzing) [Solidesulfovibrio fructosivorans JJ]]|uniref:asparagine synthase (glutamine-hydrolyzing) n=1 Tax=Solidesulfovibrio fructosivorans JJ] TaxID=596151 RepID=E1JXW1_SOLFR|nr:asparagine synthase (glutamine-hydrolyzing) [Solidesulfovibrio fructosivorans]EFL50884.1 asparagine synthase (glutamine-hydrolyzing) [Solidesulfovibrio fructosivorans JJ]]
MCGICGVFAPDRIGPEHRRLIETQNDIMRHRGPDATGIFADAHCALGHRRLAIIDLSADGRQPFASPDGRYQMVFNGEIFNYIELRDELANRGRVFTTKTDTEVLLAAYETWGPQCLSRLNGMFALAIYDTRAKTLFLARDRFGIKPLYYTRLAGRLYFASEIKALLTVPGLSRAVRRQSLFDYLAFNRTDIHDETFFEHVSRLPKGCRAICDALGGLSIETWWSPLPFLDTAVAASPEETRREVEALFIDAARLRLRSDVPVGSSLSGGLDSSILVGVLHDRLTPPSPYHCFTAVYPGDPVDETRYVDALAGRYPFLGHRVAPTAAETLADLPDFVRANDEPTTGPSFYAQYRVMRLAREAGVVVVLDGQGADEIFAGYQYFHGFYMYGLLRRGRLSRLAAELWGVATRRQHPSAVQTLAYQMLPEAVRTTLLRRTVPHLRRDFFEAHIGQSRIQREFFRAKGLNHSLALHFLYKLEHLLRMEDRNSMAFSLEARVPYLDYRLVERLLATPEEAKIRGGETKVLQKQALGRYTVPEILARTDKLGFATPEARWMSAPGWRERITVSMDTLSRAFPDVFAFLPGCHPAPQEAWKFCQLATWLELFG